MKSVLVIETPENCFECPIEKSKQCPFLWEDVESLGRPKTCPLRPLPEKRVYKDNYNRFSSQLAYEQGWNRVIEEITGEAEEIDARNKWWADHSSRFD